jgi:hypothetical protein
MKSILIAAVCALAPVVTLGQSASHSSLQPATGLVPLGNGSELRPVTVAPETLTPEPSSNHQRVGVVSDWSQHHLLFPTPKSQAVAAKIQSDPRFTQNWYIHHRDAWWPGSPHGRLQPTATTVRDWSETLGSVTFQPIFDFPFSFPASSPYAAVAGIGSINSFDQLNGTFLATAGQIAVTTGSYAGTYPLLPGGPNDVTAPNEGGTYNNLLYPTTIPPVDDNGLMFYGPDSSSNDHYINFYGDGGDVTGYYDSYNGTIYENLAATPGMTLYSDPGGGQTYPAKYTFDVSTALTPASCTNDYVAIGIPATPTTGAGGQANIIGYNNLYSGTNGYCGPTPSLLFAYASGTGEVPASIALSLDGTQLAYVEDILPGAASNPNGASYLHVLTWNSGDGVSGGTAAPIVPANDVRVPLVPLGTSITQSSTTAPFIDYTSNCAYVTTYSWATNSGYVFKINNVFGAGSSPAIVWSVEITGAVPSGAVYDTISQNVFFTDSEGRIDYVADAGTSGTFSTGPTVASGTTSLNAVTVDSVNEFVYATFNTNGATTAPTEIVVQAPINTDGTLGTPVSAPIGKANLSYTGPYGVEFNDYWYNGGTSDGNTETSPELYVVGTDTTNGTVPTLYGVGFTGLVMNNTTNGSAALANGVADGAPPTEFYNANANSGAGQDYLFVGVSNYCVNTSVTGYPIGCSMSLPITESVPTVGTTVTAYHASGGVSGIIVDNDSTEPQASSIYYASKSGATPGNAPAAGLFKLTQSGLQ